MLSGHRDYKTIDTYEDHAKNPVCVRVRFC